MTRHAPQYSVNWFDLFVTTIDPVQTRREVEFLIRHLSLPRFRRIMDICCGTGRHAELLAGRGYQMACIDINEYALTEARRRLGGRGEVVCLDMRQIDRLPGTFDGAILLWQSFGYFDDRTNHEILHNIAEKLPRAGRFILDIYHRHFFESRQGTLQHEKRGRTLVETKRMHGDRLTVQLQYDDALVDTFEWQLFLPHEIIATAGMAGFEVVLSCSEYDESRQPSSDRPRMQLVFERG